MLVLKQSTAIDIRMGPFLDVTDGITPETGVTIAASDEAEVLKANGAATVAMTGTFAAVTGCDGWYDYTVAAGDVDTVGEVVFVMQDDSVYLPVFVRGYVVEEAVYDAMYAASAGGPLQPTTAGRTLDITAGGEAGIDLDNTSGTLAAAQIASNAITADKIATDAITAAKIAADAIGASELATDAVNEIVDQVWDEAAGDHVAAGSMGAQLGTDVDAILTDTNSLNDTKVPDTISLANINAEVVDVVATDTIAELAQAAPDATPTMRSALMLMYMALRNRLDIDTSGATDYKEIYNDAGTVITKKALTDDGTTYSEAEMESGP